jgi:hypothetical protein
MGSQQLVIVKLLKQLAFCNPGERIYIQIYKKSDLLQHYSCARLKLGGQPL